MPTIDGLQQYNDWFSTLPITEVESMLSPLNDIIDAAIIIHQASSTFLPLVS
jgi:ABC-type cobalt transport system substrate-binding protein